LIEEYTYLDLKLNNGFTDEDFSKSPLPYTISRYGKSGLKEVALTFDDGPVPGLTEKILKKETPSQNYKVLDSINDEPIQSKDDLLKNLQTLVAKTSIATPEIDVKPDLKQEPKIEVCAEVSHHVTSNVNVSDLNR